jgi:hypothetical protein
MFNWLIPIVIYKAIKNEFLRLSADSVFVNLTKTKIIVIHKSIIQ